MQERSTHDVLVAHYSEIVDDNQEVITDHSIHVKLEKSKGVYNFVPSEAGQASGHAKRQGWAKKEIENRSLIETIKGHRYESGCLGTFFE